MSLVHFHFLDTKREALLPVGEHDSKSLAEPVLCKTGILGPCGRQRIRFARDRLELRQSLRGKQGVARYLFHNGLGKSVPACCSGCGQIEKSGCKLALRPALEWSSTACIIGVWRSTQNDLATAHELAFTPFGELHLAASWMASFLRRRCQRIGQRLSDLVSEHVTKARTLLVTKVRTLLVTKVRLLPARHGILFVGYVEASI